MKQESVSPERPVVPTFSRAQLLASATLGVPRDVLAALLKENEAYTREQALTLASDFMKRKV